MSQKLIKTKPKKKTVLLVVQQGGSTKEMYLHTFDDRKQVRNYRRSCDRASYNTSGAIEIPLALEKYLDTVSEIIDAALEMALP